MLIAFILYYPSLFGFFTHDDFFHLKISQVASFKEFLNFFNILNAPEGWGFYRPLTTQVFYFLGRTLFNSVPFWMHAFSFVVFFLIIILVYRLALILTKKETVAILTAFLYATSATHFGHLYFLGTFQELGLAFFFLMSVLLFVQFLKNNTLLYYFFSIIFFLLALTSKETAVMLPLVLLLVFGFTKLNNKIVVSKNRLVIVASSFLVVQLFYLSLRFFLYGLVQGESYIWDFSPRFLNTLFWYGLWSFNLPEMLVDFVGPGLSFNPNLFKFWSKEIVPIFLFFGAVTAHILYLALKVRKKLTKKDFLIIIFSLLWFVLTLMPVLFLPLHKFTFYLTLPLIGVVLVASYLIEKANVTGIFKLVFASVWVALSIFTLQLTKETHWISQGAEVAKNAYTYFNEYQAGEEKVFVSFYDTDEDKELPWSPSELVKVVLSQNNFFEVFFQGEFELLQEGDEQPEGEIIRVKARDLLNY